MKVSIQCLYSERTNYCIILAVTQGGHAGRRVIFRHLFSHRISKRVFEMFPTRTRLFSETRFTKREMARTRRDFNLDVGMYVIDITRM